MTAHPDVELPLAPPTPRTPERRLVVAILERAIADLATCHRPVTRAWLRSDRQDEGAFAWCCAVLGLEVDAVRRRLLALADLPPAGAPRSGA